MKRRITIEVDDGLLQRARIALGRSTMRATVEEALRLAAETEEHPRGERSERQNRYLSQLVGRADLDVLASSEMWR